MMKISLMLITLFATVGYATTPTQIKKLAKNYGYERPLLLEAIIKRESGFNPLLFNAEKSGSYGLMQIQCDTAKHMGLKYSCDQLFDPDINIRFGVKWLEFIEGRLEDPTPENIIASYNAGFDKKTRDLLVAECLKNNAAFDAAENKELLVKQDCKEIKWSPRRCKKYNLFNYPGFPPMECFPGEYINEEYVWKVFRTYSYLKGKEQ